MTIVKKTIKAKSWSRIAQQVPCGKCPNCKKARANAWAFRLYNEMRKSTAADFITLTYEETPKTANGFGTLNKRDVQLFMKRLRKKNENPIKYYLCGEYGGTTSRPHYHLVAFNVDRLFTSFPDLLSQTWGKGQIHIGKINMASIRYVTGYVCKGDRVDESLVDVETGEIIEDDRVKEFSLMSKNLGLSYLTPKMVDYYVNNLISYATLKGGQLIALPRYYRDKIFSESEKIQLKDQLREYRERNVEELFYSPTHEVEYIRDQFRKTTEEAKLRIKI